MKSNLPKTILQAIALSMGVAVIVMSILRTLTPVTGMFLLGIGVTALSIAGLQN